MFEIASTATFIDRAADQHHLKRISDALDELATVDATLAEVVDFKFFCGFSFADIGAMRGVSERAPVQRDWEKARILPASRAGQRVTGSLTPGEATLCFLKRRCASF